MQSLFSLDELVLEYPEVYGISTPMRHLRVGYVLRSSHYFDVVYEPEVSSYNRESSHGAYHLTFLDDLSTVLVIKNKGSNSHYYSKYKTADYLLCSLTENEINKEIPRIISKLMGISICFALEKPNQKEILNFTQLL
ncbi:MAG: hypothetical protein ACI9GO_000644 [Bacteroidia bacterium]